MKGKHGESNHAPNIPEKRHTATVLRYEWGIQIGPKNYVTSDNTVSGSPLASRPKHVAKHLPLLVREQVSVTAAVGFRAVADELVDEPLIDAFGREVRHERVSHHMPSAKYRPFRATH